MKYYLLITFFVISVGVKSQSPGNTIINPIDSIAGIKTVRYEDGAVYEGQIINGKRNGQGKMTYKDSTVYNGNWLDDKQNGQGKIKLLNGERYEGEFKNGVIDGKGAYFFKNGSKYYGDFVNGVLDGNGIYYFKNGDRYEGHYVKGKRQGRGKYYYADGRMFDGYFENDKKVGNGTMVFSGGDKYVGDFANNSRNGKGIVYFANGERFEGSFVNNKMEGSGTFFLADGSKIIGIWKNDVINGDATIIDVKGSKRPYVPPTKDLKKNRMLLPFFQSEYIEAGCDEAGRGCLAGPVFAAAVILPKDYSNKTLNDSKQIAEQTRYALREIIEKDAIAFAVAQIGAEEIDHINILNASIKAMHLSLDQLKKKFQFIIVDGNKFKPYKNIPHQTIVKGDGKYLSIAAASILAKTYRDDFMTAAHNNYPQYDWINNKGYGTLKHRQAMMAQGTSPLHRKSFHLKEQQLKFF